MISPEAVDLLGLGIAPVDFFVYLDAYPRSGFKVNAVPESSLIAGGGPVANALCAFSRFGGTTSLITAFGDDYWGRFAREELDRFGVAHDLCLSRKGCSSALASAWINITNGERTIALDMSPRLYVRPQDIQLSRLPIPKLILIDGRYVDADVRLARWGRKVGAAVMLDIGSVRNSVDVILPHIDYLICADQYALHYFRTEDIIGAAEGFRKLGIPEVVVTVGTGGSFGIDASGHCTRQRAFKVKAVDVTGAGDVYHGAYLFGIMKGWDLAKKMRFAAAAAALKCRLPGARSGIPSLRQTLHFMKNHRAFHA